MKRWYRFRGLLLLVVAEMERTDRHTHTHKTTTVTLAAHARRGLITTVQCRVCSQLNNKPRVVVTDAPSFAIIYGFTKWLLLEVYL